jgi:hypothetical protein
MRLPSHCIVIDLSAHSPVLKFPLNILYKSPSTTFQWFYFSIGDARLLVEYQTRFPVEGTIQHSSSKFTFRYTDTYRAIDGDSAVLYSAWPCAKKYHGRVSSRRTIHAYDTWDHAPNSIGTVRNAFMAEDGSELFWLESSALRIDFKEQR